MDMKYIVESREISEEKWTPKGTFRYLEEAREYVYDRLKICFGFDYRIRKIYSDGEYFYDR